MSKKWIVIYAVALVLLPVFLFVFIRFESPSEMLSPPKLYGENAKIQEAFEKSVPNSSDIILKYPSQGEYRTPFVLYDVDNDGEKEAVVFYSLKSDETAVRINIFDKTDGEWKSVYDDIGYGSDILSISFKDLNHDKRSEILCCWSLFDSNSSKVLTVHTTSNSSPVEFKTLANVQYSYTATFDFDQDKDEEIFVVWTDVGNKQQRNLASLLKLDEKNNMIQLGKPVILDSSVSSYSDAFLNIKDENRTILLDAYKGENSMITEILCWNNTLQTLENVSIDSETLATTSTQRTPAISCADVNKDNIYEIPTNNSQSPVEKNIVEITTWMSVNNGTIVPCSKAFINQVEQSNVYYSIFVPAGISENVSATRTNSSVLTVYYDEEPMFSVVCKKTADISNDESFSFKTEYKEYSAYGTLTNVGIKYGLQDEVLENAFVFIE